jgi:serine/threonine protein kinase
MARFVCSNGLIRFFCIKRMLGEPITEKRLFDSIRREMQILFEVSELPGCVTLIDIVNDDESLGLVFPYYPHGDLYSFVKAANRRRVLPERAVRVIFV